MVLRTLQRIFFLASTVTGAIQCGGSAEDDSSETKKTPLTHVVESLGGPRALAGLHTLSFDAEGVHSAYDEGFDAGSAPTAASDFTLAARIDADAGNMRLSYKRNYLAIVPGTVNEYSEILVGPKGYVRGVESVFGGPPGTVGAFMTSARWAATRRHQWFSNPHLLVRAMLERDVRDEGIESRGGIPYRRFVVSDPDGVHDLTLWLDGNGGLSRLSTVESDHLRGDVRVDVRYEQWEPSGGLVFPRKVTFSVDGEVVRVENRSKVEINPPLGEDLFELPNAPTPDAVPAQVSFGRENAQSFQRFAGLGLNSFVDATHDAVVGVEVAAGVYHLVGTGHHSLLIDQGMGSVLVEAPLDEARSNALLAWMDTNLPGGRAAHPITKVIMTHHHADHSAGLRTFVAQGATVVMGKESESFMREVFANERTIRPDALSARKDTKPAIEAIEPEGSLAMGNVTAHHVRSSHSSDMLVVHIAVPGTAGLLFNSDLYNPTEGRLIPARVERANGFNAAMVQRGLAKDDLILLGGHGNMDGARHFNVTYARFKQQLDEANAVRVSVFPGASNWPTWVAQEKGLFDAENIRVETSPTPTSVFQMTGLIEGRIDIALTAIDNIVAYREGQGEAPITGPDLVAVMGIDNGFLALEAAPDVRSYADLRGKVVSVDALSTGFAFVLYELLERGGLQRGRDVTIASVGGTATRFEALMAGKHAATLLTPPFDIEAEERQFNRLARAVDVLGPYQGLVAGVRKSWADAHRDAVVAYISAFSKAVDWLFDPVNEEEAIAICERNDPRATRATATAVYTRFFGSKNSGFSPDGDVDMEGTRKVLELRSKYATPPRELTDPAKYHDPSFRSAASQRPRS